MSLLHIRLLGDFSLTYGDQAMNTVNQARVQSLLGYLLLHRHAPQARHHLAFIFWPDVAEAHARNNLRKMLHQLRHSLPDADQFLHSDANTVQWAAGAPFRLDVADFEAAVAGAAKAAGGDGGSDRGARCHALQAALGLYRGELLPSCYDDWVAPERERLHQQAVKICRQLIALLEEQRNYTAAIEVGRRLLHLDPLDEAAYASLMRIHALNDDRVGALRVYHDCVTILQRELEVEPGDEVQAAYKRLLHLDKKAVAVDAQPSGPPGAIPLVGRQAEWVQVQEIWRQSARGQPAFVLITGEAGIGKTRLAEELLVWVQRQGIAGARTRAYSAEGRLSYAPIVEWLRSTAVAPVLARLDKVWLSEIARLLPELLAAHPDLPPPAPLAEHWQRQRFFEALARGTLAIHAPLLLLIDDLQWCDPETLEWLRFLLRFEPKAPLLLAGTARSDEMNAEPALAALLRALRSAGQLHELALAPLDAAEVANLAGRIGGRELETAETMHLFRETEGNPLFVVEMVRGGLRPEIGAPEPWREFTPSISQANAPSRLPPRIYAVIAGRLDQLSDGARELVGTAATIGRAFTLDVLARASGTDEESLVDALEELWQRRIVREQGANAYDFSHDKLRDVAYRELSPMQQRKLHRRIAQALQELHAADLPTVSGRLAVHYEEAGLPEQAIQHYRQAADVARRLLAYEEAINHLNRALLVLAALPETTERQEQRLALLIALGTLLSAAKGNAALPVREVYTQALELCRRVGDMRQTFVVQQELRIGCGQRGEMAAARELAQDNLALAQELASPELLRYAHLGMGVVCHTAGELDLARTHFDQAIVQPVAQSGDYDPMFFDNALQGSLRHSALTLWLMGYPDQARARMEGALAAGRQNAQSIRYAITLYFAAMLHHYLGEVQAVRLAAQEIKALAAAYGFAYYQTSALMFEGWVLARQGKSPQGTVQLRQALEARKASMHRLFLPYEMSLLSEAYLAEGETAAGLANLEDALAVVVQTGERVWQAELLRLQAELRLAQGIPGRDVEALYRQAIELARRQGARSLELRACASLARLWHDAGRSGEARELLAPVYASFTEGLDTLDLQEAGALLKT
jgi:DNA-binding SARP family transcriptional activator/predicted ATPase